MANCMRATTCVTMSHEIRRSRAYGVPDGPQAAWPRDQRGQGQCARYQPLVAQGRA